MVRGLCARALCLRGCLRCGAGVDRRWYGSLRELGILVHAILGILLGFPRAVEFLFCSGPTSPPRPAEALRLPMGLG